MFHFVNTLLTHKIEARVIQYILVIKMYSKHREKNMQHKNYKIGDFHYIFYGCCDQIQSYKQFVCTCLGNIKIKT